MSSSDKPKKDFAEMTESEIAMRKFLKALGVTTHQKLEQALADAVSRGRVAGGGSVDITANIDIPELGFSHQITATLTAPSETS